MKVYCAGFNLYGQFPTIEDVCIINFTKKDYNNLTDLEICHTFSVAKVDGKIKLHGYINKHSHQSTEITELGINEVVQISASDSFVLFLLNSGKIWRLSENSSNYHLENISNFVKTEDSNDDYDDKIIKISCGITFSCAYSFFGFFYNIPQKIKTDDLNVLDMCSGRQHCLILSKDGLLYSIGSGRSVSYLSNLTYLEYEH